ncbi:hypothetical protein BGZ59_007479 [Podila verticillata]|nr:hypothetical protein BGZ59_007479 [Podila verticillata]KFH68748.1 hypothetical protein MVEG_05555 [Podila verticillata NRRL 6337]
MDDFDPTADFLAREQAALGGDTDFLSGFTSAPTSSTAHDSAQDFESSFPSFDNVTSSITSPPMSNSSHIAPSVVVADNDDDFGAFHSDFPAIETSDVPASQTFAASIPIQATGASGFSNPASSPSISRAPQFKSQTQEAVPEIIKEWRDKQAAIVADKDERSEVKRQETIGAAHEAIDRFYEDYNQKKSKSIAENRDKEEAFLAKRDDVSSGTQWERINRHLDSSPAAVTAALKAGRRDTSRMRELLRDLEKDPNAPGK